jgi:transposase
MHPLSAKWNMHRSQYERSLLIERGITVPQGGVPLRKLLPEILSSNTDVLSPRIVSLAADPAQDPPGRAHCSRVGRDRSVGTAGRQQPAPDERAGDRPNHLERYGGGDSAGFKQGRDFGAWLELVPKQQSTGDRTIWERSPNAVIRT